MWSTSNKHSISLQESGRSSARPIATCAQVNRSQAGVAPAYSELESCLQMTRASRQLNNQKTGEDSGNEAAPPRGATAQNQ